MIVAAMILCASLLAGDPAVAGDGPARRVSLIDCTDLYHPHQDVGDNVDIVAAYALPEVDLKAIILDVTQQFRTENGVRRDAGFIPVVQLNSIFNRNVPCGVTPYAKMKSPEDPMLDTPRFQQIGVELLLKVLREAKEPVEITIFGSARAVAVAYNRKPSCSRNASNGFTCVPAPGAGLRGMERDARSARRGPVAAERFADRDYPCATKEGPFAYGPHNCFWLLNDLHFIEAMQPQLRAYLAFAFSESNRMDFLRAMEEDPPPALLTAISKRTHNVWETCVWMEITGRHLVPRADGQFRILPAGEVKPGDTVLPNELRPVRVKVRDDGQFAWEADRRSDELLDVRPRRPPAERRSATQGAAVALYESFRP